MLHGAISDLCMGKTNEELLRKILTNLMFHFVFPARFSFRSYDDA